MVNKNNITNVSNYKFYPAKSGIVLLLVLWLISFSGCLGDKKITEAEVLDVLNKIDVAAKNKDADAIAAFLSEKVQIKTTFTASGQTQTSKFTRDQYVEVLRKSFAIGTNYTYSRENTRITISSDGKSAIVSDETTESITVNGQVIRSFGAEVATLVRENGKLVYLFMEATGKQF